MLYLCGGDVHMNKYVLWSDCNECVDVAYTMSLCSEMLFRVSGFLMR